MIRWAFALALMLIAIWAAPRLLAQMTLTGVGGFGNAPPPPPPPPASCNGQLNFSQACNAVYAH